MRQRTALARLMALEPQVLLMDEPLAALDAQTRIILQGELLRIWGQERPASERRTVVFITHAIDEAVFLADRVAVMTSHPGRLKALIDVALPRPRDDSTRATPEFQALAQTIWGLIRTRRTAPPSPEPPTKEESMTHDFERRQASRRRFVTAAGAASLALAVPGVRAQGRQAAQGVGRPPALGRRQLADHAVDDREQELREVRGRRRLRA
jgi:ABC-type proline/glycine betaine transport system ATPase subunit